MTSPTDHALRLPAWLSSLFFLALLGLVGLTAWQWRDGPPVSANLLQLLPSGAPGELEQLAELHAPEGRALYLPPCSLAFPPQCTTMSLWKS